MSERLQRKPAGLSHPATPTSARESYFKDGDRIAFYGDSITECDIYPKAVEGFFRLLHPQANVHFINNGRSGRKAADACLEDALRGDPNVVCVMLGGNDAINGHWREGLPIEPPLGEYEAAIRRLVRDLRVAGKEAILLSPLLRDERCETTCFRIDGTSRLLQEMARVCQAIAREEGIHFIPMQREFEEAEQALPLSAMRLRYDGVHPTSAGEYQIAMILARHLGLSSSLARGARTLNAVRESLPVAVSIRRKLVPGNLDAVQLDLVSPTRVVADFVWSGGGHREAGSVVIDGDAQLKLCLPMEVFPGKEGDADSIFLSMRDASGREAFFVIDLAVTRVLHMKDGCCRGSIGSAGGTVACDFEFRKEGRGLRFKARVNTSPASLLRSGDFWPWGSSSLTLYLDLRPESRFAGPALEGDVHQIWFIPRTEPFPTVRAQPWYGRHLAPIFATRGEVANDCYSVDMLLSGDIDIQTPFDIDHHECIAFDLAVFDVSLQSDGEKKTLVYPYRKGGRPSHLFANGFTIIDLRNQNQGDLATTLHVFPFANEALHECDRGAMPPQCME